MKKLFVILVSSLLLTGCGTLIPKKVEFFQDKVAKVPEITARERETQKQAAALAAVRAKDTLVAAVSNDAPASVVIPATDTAKLTEAVSDSVGPPLDPWEGKPAALAAKLEKSIAKLDKRIEDFKEDNNENAGKKIEGTGLFQIPYFVWLAVCAVIAFIGLIVLSVIWAAVKVYALSNPPLALGMNAASLAARTASKGLTQLISGGEKFKEAVQAKFGPSSEVASQVLEMFRVEHQKEQDGDVKTVVNHLTK